MSQDNYTFIRHDGVEGMKWHQRRYQNEDGTWTAEGLERRRAQYKAARGGRGRQAARAINAAVGVGLASGSVGAVNKAIYNDKSATEKAFKPGKEGKPSDYVKVMNSSKDMISETSKIDKLLSGDPKDIVETNDLTNAELKSMIDRLRLEKDYKDLVSADISSGRDKVRDYLTIAGSIVTVGVGVATVAQIIKSLKGKQ